MVAGKWPNLETHGTRQKVWVPLGVSKLVETRGSERERVHEVAGVDVGVVMFLGLQV